MKPQLTDVQRILNIERLWEGQAYNLILKDTELEIAVATGEGALSEAKKSY
jgi:hypothetical protein